MNAFSRLGTFITLLMLIFGMTSVQAQDRNLYDSVLVNDLDPAYALEWIDLLYDRVWYEAVSAPGAARLYGYAAVAMYTALLPGMPNNYSMQIQLNDFPDIPYPSEDHELDWLSVMNGTMSTIMIEMFAKGSDDTIQRISDLRARHKQLRLDATSFEIVEHSLRYGDEVTEHLIDWMNSDGYIETRGRAYEIPTGDLSSAKIYP